MNDSTSFEIANFPWELKQFQISIFKCFSICEKSKSIQTPPKLFVVVPNIVMYLCGQVPHFYKNQLTAQNITNGFCNQCKINKRERPNYYVLMGSSAIVHFGPSNNIGKPTSTSSPTSLQEAGGSWRPSHGARPSPLPPCG